MITHKEDVVLEETQKKPEKKEPKKLEVLDKIEEASNENEEVIRLERRKKIAAQVIQNQEILDNPLKVFEEILHEEGVDEQVKLDLFLCNILNEDN
jgi:hypothetical protein